MNTNHETEFICVWNELLASKARKIVRRLEKFADAFEYMTKEFKNVYDVESATCGLDFVATNYQRSLELITISIAKTYMAYGPNDWGQTGKETFVRALSAFYKGNMMLKTILINEENTDKVQHLLRSVRTGSTGDTSTLKSKLYMCYRHFHCCQDMDAYEITTYNYNTYSRIEIYDYYFAQNKGCSIHDDRFIKCAYNKWFVYNISFWLSDGYMKPRGVCDPPTLFKEEIESNIIHSAERLEYHQEQLDRYNAMLQDEHYISKNDVCWNKGRYGIYMNGRCTEGVDMD